jgi:hypothetical protein
MQRTRSRKETDKSEDVAQRAAGISGFRGADDYNGEQMAAPVAQMDRAAVS